MAERETQVNAVVTLGCIFCPSPGGRVRRLLRVFPFQPEQVPDPGRGVLHKCSCVQIWQSNWGVTARAGGVPEERHTEQNRD